MRLYEIYQTIKENEVHGNFVGFYCSKNQIKKFRGKILDNYYEYIPQILEGIDYEDKYELFKYFEQYNKELTELNIEYQIDLNNLPEEYEENYSSITNQILIEINKKYEWIFVFEKHPLVEYGEYCYRVYFKESDGKIILLLVGGEKSTQQKDIEKAKEILNRIKK